MRTTNGSVTNISAEHDRRPREGDVDADRRCRPVEREQRQAGDDRRQREGQVDDRVHDRLAAEVVADEHPGGDRPEHRVEQATPSDATSVSFSAATASGLETASQKDCEPSLVASQMSAAIGSADQHRQERRHEADGQGRCGPVRVRLCAARGRDRDGRRASQCRHRPAFSIFAMTPVFGIEELLLRLRPAADRLRVDRELTGSKRELLPVRLEDLLHDRPVAVVREHLLRGGRREELQERVRLLRVFRRPRDRDRVLDEDRRAAG